VRDAMECRCDEVSDDDDRSESLPGHGIVRGWRHASTSSDKVRPHSSSSVLKRHAPTRGCGRGRPKNSGREPEASRNMELPFDWQTWPWRVRFPGSRPGIAPGSWHWNVNEGEMAMRSSSLLLAAVLAFGCGDGYGVTNPPQDGGPDVVDAVGVTSWSPSTITIKAGDVVQFRNSSSTTHNVRFDQDVTGHPGDVDNFASASRSVTFATPGTYAYHCGIHPVMQGTVVVQP
jgi:plastocyanin